jgi:hypothetical protein
VQIVFESGLSFRPRRGPYNTVSKQTVFLIGLLAIALKRFNAAIEKREHNIGLLLDGDVLSLFPMG